MLYYAALIVLLCPLLFWLADEGEWFSFVCAAALVVVLCLVYAQSASAGFDSPFKHATLEQRLEAEALPGSRCPKLSNPMECSRSSAGGRQTGVQRGSRYAEGNSCSWLHVMYAYHHSPGQKPARLKLLHGCSLWRTDASYHIRAERLRLSDPQQELIEQLSTLVIALEGVLHVQS